MTYKKHTDQIYDSNHSSIQNIGKYNFFFNITKIMIVSVSITQPLDFDCRITNDFPCIVYEHLIGLTITG